MRSLCPSPTALFTIVGIAKRKKIKKIHSYTCSIYQPSAGLFTNEKPFPTAKLKLRWGKNCRLVLHIVFFLFQMVLKSFKVQRTLQIESPNKRLDARIESRETKTETSCKNMKNYSAVAYHSIP